MSVDVIRYNTLNCNTQIQYNAFIKEQRKRFSACPWDTSLWLNDFLPMCITSGTVLRVCDSGTTFRCGACCLWTVPAGVSRAQFQLWGAGAGTGGIACCGFSMPGPTGAYAIVTIPVTPGNQYTLCAGCALCCYAQDPNSASACNITGGCASFVTGPGLTNVCAEGATNNHMRALVCYNGINSGTVLGSMDRQDSTFFSNCSNCWNHSSYVICGGGSSICGGGGNPGFFLPITKSDRTFYGNTSTSGVNVCGLPGMFAGGCFNFPGNFCGYFLIPPVPTPLCATAHVPDLCYYGACWCCQIMCVAQTGGCCCNANTAGGFFKWPGQGGVGSIVFGSNVCLCGDAGRMGMVEVTYC